MAPDEDWLADLQRYGSSKAFLREQSIWAVWIYRFGRRVDRLSPNFYRRILTFWYWFLFRIVETLLGVSIPKAAQIGPGLRIWHFGGIFIHSDAVVGSNFTLRQGVTIGNRYEGGAVPTIGNNVEVGAYAQILGGLRIGNDCRIGAMSVVLIDVPDGTSAVGVPARIVQRAH